MRWSHRQPISAPPNKTDRMLSLSLRPAFLVFLDNRVLVVWVWLVLITGYDQILQSETFPTSGCGKSHLLEQVLKKGLSPCSCSFRLEGMMCVCVWSFFHWWMEMGLARTCQKETVDLLRPSICLKPQLSARCRRFHFLFRSYGIEYIYIYSIVRWD